MRCVRKAEGKTSPKSLRYLVVGAILMFFFIAIVVALCRTLWMIETQKRRKKEFCTPKMSKE